MSSHGLRSGTYAVAVALFLVPLGRLEVSRGLVDPPKEVAALAGRAEVGVEWGRVEGASSYELHWSTRKTPSGEETNVIEDVRPGFVHRGLEPGKEVHYRVVARAGEQTSRPSKRVSATPGGVYGLRHMGTGRVFDFAEEETVSVPIERRLHTILCAEGYLEAELASGAFDRDVERWMENVFSVWPYDELREAFVVWTLPAASNEHVSPTSPQESDTAFRVPVTENGRGVHSSVPQKGDTAVRVWAALADFPHPAEAFYPRGGRTSLMAKDLLIALIVLNPKTGRGGLSGRARRLENPSSSKERISVAIGLDYAHEFSHALARVEDEYLDHAQTNGMDNGKPLVSATVSNVVRDPSRERLPWRHLLFEGEINPKAEGLVGAFGDPKIGYHSELKCLMNGGHDNADFFGGRGNLRVRRFCNYCRELMVFRMFERVGILDEPKSSYELWVDRYRAPFYARFGFSVPNEVPQTNSSGEPIFRDAGPKER